MELENIVYLGGCWPTNIGNAFIDLGALECLRRAFPRARVSIVSELPREVFRKEGKTDHALRLDCLVDCDAFVVSGMTCCDEFVNLMGPIVRGAALRGVPTLFVGCGQWDYSEAETENFRRFLQEVEPPLFVSRDEPTFRNMSGCSRNEIEGIDCGFFLPEAYAPAPFLLREYAVAAFDAEKEPRLAIDVPVFRAHHCILGDAAKDQYRHPDTLVSDLPQDYLNLYAHARDVYSDRVHACVAALSYGNRARLFSPTPRGALFEAVGAGGIREALVSLDMDRLAELKRGQVEAVQSVLRPQPQLA